MTVPNFQKPGTVTIFEDLKCTDIRAQHGLTTNKQGFQWMQTVMHAEEIGDCP